MFLIASEVGIQSSPIKYRYPPKSTTSAKECPFATPPIVISTPPYAIRSYGYRGTSAGFGAHGQRSSSSSSLGGEIDLSRKLPAIRSFLAAASICNNIQYEKQQKSGTGRNEPAARLPQEQVGPLT